MKELLRLLQATGSLTGLASHLPALVGAETYALLELEGLLEEAGAASRYPCPSGDLGCPRRLAALGGGRHLAYCGNVPNGCEDLELPEAALRQVRLPLERLLGLLQRTLDLSGELLPDPLLERTWVLGRRAWGGQEREVAVSFAANAPTFSSYLAARQAVRGPSLVLAPTRGRLPAEVLRAHLTGAAVELAFLDELLELSGDRLRLARAPGESPAAKAYCLAFEDGLRRELSAAEYQRLAKEAHRFDLFIDLCSGSQSIRCGRRSGGRFAEDTLSLSEASALARLIEAKPKPLRIAELSTVAARDKLFARARAKVDLLERGEWRCFRPAGGEKRDRAVAFSPPEGVRYLLLRFL